MGEDDCTDSIDNDGDSFVDCFDQDCFTNPACGGGVIPPGADDLSDKLNVTQCNFTGSGDGFCVRLETVDGPINDGTISIDIAEGLDIDLDSITPIGGVNTVCVKS